MFFCHTYAFGYALNVWAGCNNMFLSYICVWLCLKCGQAVTCFLSYIRVWLCLKCVGRL